MSQIFLNTKEDCDWLRETHLAPKNLNNCPAGALEFKSSVLNGNEDCPKELLTYQEESPSVTDKPVRWLLTESGRYSGFPV